MNVNNFNTNGNEVLITTNTEFLKKIDKNLKNETFKVVIKRIIDIIGGLVGVIMLIPLTIGIYIASRILKDKGPIFYTQNRIGKDGKIFKMYKYRSMVIDADEKLAEYLKENEEAREEFKKYRKLKDDPRITKIGKFIRKTSIDEFPQFINVLKGDMSLVGPRPYILEEQKEMGSFYNNIIECKPGITGLWQVSGRNNITFNDRLNIDMEYYYNDSIRLDMKILYKTVKQVFLKEGAM